MSETIEREEGIAQMIFFSPNVPRQVSLAGGAGRSQTTEEKALGLLFCQQALCLSGRTSNRRSSKHPAGQRLTGRARSAMLFAWVMDDDQRQCRSNDRHKPDEYQPQRKGSPGSVACDMNGCPYCREEPYGGLDCKLQMADAKCLK